MYHLPSGLKVGCLFLLTKKTNWFVPQGHWCSALLLWNQSKTFGVRNCNTMLKPVLCNTIPKAMSNTVTFHHICAWSILQLLQLAWLIDGPQSKKKKKRSRQPAATTLQAPGPLTQSIKEESITLNKHMLHKHTHTHKHTQSNCSSLIMKHVHYMNRKADKQTIIHASSLIQWSVHYSHCFGADSVERTSGTKKCLSHWLQKTLSWVRSLVWSRQTWGVSLSLNNEAIRTQGVMLRKINLTTLTVRILFSFLFLHSCPRFTFYSATEQHFG